MRIIAPRGTGHGCGRGKAQPDAARRRSLASRICTTALRAVPLIAIITALASTGTAASAATAPDACAAADVVAKALPAIINVTVVKLVPAEDTPRGKPSEEVAAAGASNTAAGDNSEDHVGVFVGSGAVIDPSGIIITNKHVIQDAAMISVIFNDKVEVPAQLIAAGQLVDLALLKVNLPAPLPALQFGDSDALRIGQPVIAVGNPLGLGTSVSTGVVSALNRNLVRTPVDDFIQTDATINPGNSGGPLLDCKGDIIGINTALVSNNKQLGSIGLGFALPSNVAQFVAAKLRNPETAAPNWIGLHLQDLTTQIATAFGRSDAGGAIVTDVDPDSPAARASLAPGDIITNAEGEPLPDAREILRMAIIKPSGEPIALTVWRHGTVSQITVLPQPWPHMVALRSEVLASAAAVARAQALGLCRGLVLSPITPEKRRRFGLSDSISGVLVDQVIAGSQAATVGIAPGDVIEQVGEQSATTAEQVIDRLDHGQNVVALRVRSKSDTQWIPLHVGHLDITALVAPAPTLNAGSARDAAASRPQGGR